MPTRAPRDSEKAARLSLPPARTYEVPGGPYARDLGEVDVYKLSEVARGGPDDPAR